MFGEPLPPGRQAPEFRLTGHDGQVYVPPVGAPAVLAFYPADATPG
jgi:peroxiredoxin